MTAPVLSYVFWHWKRSDAPVVGYEERLRAFHSALASSPSPGFVRSCAYAIRGAPWANGGAGAWEDWYHLHDSAALDPLNDAAVSGTRHQPHDGAASLVAGGTAGLYKLRMGDPVTAVACASWFGKPAGASYGEFLDRLGPIVDASNGALWMRRMTLGPASEFCLHTPSDVALPPEVGAVTLRMRRVFPPEALSASFSA